MTTYTQHYINGAWQTATSQAFFEVHDASTEEVMATVPHGTADEAGQAALAARAAFPAWSGLTVEERCQYIDKIVAGLKARTDEMATAIAREVGMPIKLAKMVQVGGPVFNWGNAAKVARAFIYEEKVGHSLVVREPIGVVGCITPWNFPLNQITLKVAPALAAGCTVVLKPSEIAPVNAMILAEIIHSAGLPAGVFNLVNGDGPVVGEVLASHPEVDMVSFTGSTRAGKRVAALAAVTVKRVTLELGGKSASVVLPDADMVSAVKGTLAACFLNSGQTCIAPDYLLVERGVEQPLLEHLQARINTCFGEEPLHSPDLGNIVNVAQFQRLDGLLEGARSRGQLICGGQSDPSRRRISPTLIRVESLDDPLMQEELFGPLLPVLSVDDLNQAIALINQRPKPLALYLFTKQQQAQRQILERTSSGGVCFNDVVMQVGVPDLPFGGVGPSGMGSYHCEAGFRTFSHQRSVLRRPFKLDVPFRYPPYGDKLPLVRRLLG